MIKKKKTTKKKAAPGPKKNWIQGAIKHPGALHEALGMSKGQKIPLAKIKAAANSKNPQIAKMAKMALTMRNLNS